MLDAKQQLQQWVMEHRALSTPEARQEFYQRMTASLDQDRPDRAQLLSALKNTVQKLRTDLEQEIKPAPSTALHVFPTSPAEKELLEALLSRMNIPFTAG